MLVNVTFFISKAAMTLHYHYIELLLLDTALTSYMMEVGSHFIASTKYFQDLYGKKWEGLND